MDDQPPVKLDVPYFLHDPVEHMRAIKWCEGHWTELITALRSRGLESQIAESAEAIRYGRGTMSTSSQNGQLFLQDWIAETFPSPGRTGNGSPDA